MKKGIDVSSYQGDIDWRLVKEQVDFAIIRCGYGDDIERQDDSKFRRNVEECIANNIPYGVYLYSYAKRLSGSESIESEVSHVKRLIKGLKPFMVFIDMEDDSTRYLGRDVLTNMAIEFCRKMKDAGYRAGVYANENWFNNYLNGKLIVDNGNGIWCAKYSSNRPNIGVSYDIWQYASDGKVRGIVGNVDMNYMERDLIFDREDNGGEVSDKKVNVYYRVKTKRDGWLSEVKNLDDYAGWKNSPIIGVAIKVDRGSIKYRVHVKNGSWLPYVTGYDINNLKTGYAGNNKNIDAIEVYYYTPNDIRPYKKAKYKINNYSWQYDNEKTKGQDGYAGKFGVNAVKFQIEIV